MRTAPDATGLAAPRMPAPASPTLAATLGAAMMLCLSACDCEARSVCPDPVDPATLVIAKPTGTRGERLITHVCGQELVTPFVVDGGRLQRRRDVATISRRCVAASDAGARYCEDIGYLPGQIVRVRPAAKSK